jgi:hypothetical protein
MRQQFRNPPRISLVGFFARTGPHLTGIAHEHLDDAHEDMIDRLPVHTRRFHSYDRAVLGNKPITQGQQLRIGGAKLTQLRRALAVIADTAHTRH